MSWITQSMGITEETDSAGSEHPPDLDSEENRSIQRDNPSPRLRAVLRIVERAGAFILEWTPLLLVVSYFVFSTSLYMLFPSELISVFWFIYLTTNFYIAVSTVIEAVMSLTPNRDARKAVSKAHETGWVFHTCEEDLLFMDLVIVAYLPNEKDIIMDRIHYALESIRYPKEKIRINVVYNTPIAIEPLESQMRNLAMEHPQLRVIPVQNSTSKAQNLNFFLTLHSGAEIIAIFDCDHYPNPYGPRWAAERFLQDSTVDIVQGMNLFFM